MFWSYDPAGGTALISTYLETGQVDQSLYTTPHLSFTPASTQTGIAKDIVSTMIGLAVLMVVSLLLMWWRIRRRGRFGRIASAVLRSVFPLILGLGGWFLGVLIVLTASSTIAIDDELLAVVAIGVPIGLGISLAWVQPQPAIATPTPSALRQQQEGLSSVPGWGSMRPTDFSRSSLQSSEQQSAQT